MKASWKFLDSSFSQQMRFHVFVKGGTTELQTFGIPFSHKDYLPQTILDKQPSTFADFYLLVEIGVRLFTCGPIQAWSQLADLVTIGLRAQGIKTTGCGKEI